MEIPAWLQVLGIIGPEILAARRESQKELRFLQFHYVAAMTHDCVAYQFPGLQRIVHALHSRP